MNPRPPATDLAAAATKPPQAVPACSLLAPAADLRRAAGVYASRPQMDAPAAPAATEPAPPPRRRVGFVLAWCVFWLLMITVAVQDHLRHGLTDIWRPLLWEGSSCLVATLIAWRLWAAVPRLDDLLGEPWRWFVKGLRWLPPSALLFIAAVYALRHAVYALLGLTYRHDPWATVFVYESLKFSIFYLLFLAVIFGIRSHEAMLAARLRAERAQALSQRAQLLQLTQQLEPHFLFNALNTIAATVHGDPDRADALLTKLAALLRAATDLARRPSGALDDELRLLEGYTAIMCERFADRVQVHFEIGPGTRRCEVPSLLLQPLVENAFRHGVEKHPGPAHITVAAARQAGRLVLRVAQDIGALPPAPAFGTGLATLQQRLATAYGSAASLRLSPREGGGVVATVELPA